MNAWRLKKLEAKFPDDGGPIKAAVVRRFRATMNAIHGDDRALIRRQSMHARAVNEPQMFDGLWQDSFARAMGFGFEQRGDEIVRVQIAPPELCMYLETVVAEAREWAATHGDTCEACSADRLRRRGAFNVA